MVKIEFDRAGLSATEAGIIEALAMFQLATVAQHIGRDGPQPSDDDVVRYAETLIVPTLARYLPGLGFRVVRASPAARTSEP